LLSATGRCSTNDDQVIDSADPSDPSLERTQSTQDQPMLVARKPVIAVDKGPERERVEKGDLSEVHHDVTVGCREHRGIQGVGQLAHGRKINLASARHYDGPIRRTQNRGEPDHLGALHLSPSVQSASSVA
jgi:hypothetical protein